MLTAHLHYIIVNPGEELREFRPVFLKRHYLPFLLTYNYVNNILCHIHYNKRCYLEVPLQKWIVR